MAITASELADALRAVEPLPLVLPPEIVKIQVGTCTVDELYAHKESILAFWKKQAAGSERIGRMLISLQTVEPEAVRIGTPPGF